MDKEVAAFWDDFAAEYYQIQQESQVPVVTDVVAFLQVHQILPTKNVADLGGGSGRYLPSLAQNSQAYTIIDISAQMLHYAKQEAKRYVPDQRITYQQQSVTTFAEQTAPRTYDLIWMALNPAIQANQALLTITEKSRQWCAFLRLTKNEDDLFTPLERYFGIEQQDPNTAPEIIASVGNLLKNAGYQVGQQVFQYQTGETFDRPFLEAYYEELPTAQLAAYLDQVFATQKTRTSTTTLEYTLLYWHVL
ncbi:class I SAM-dependent methyltransferase [Latilactobacillus graminis]|uniref:Methyltransferase domain-containing protein n=2 Tax=Latilactobacillus graminis TaxID=60519 RepID=A0AA89I1L4_9LACO|nr:class I SAM-dependent methyltransferase [Latilactobacillus graminis]KRM23766.1 hypothetical protein FC90_GL001449 [Latilactobacillus graminis DSM 20719]QFP80142.1 class I SAM-dependent methyltransferase [Latilactobacillus graminis]